MDKRAIEYQAGQVARQAREVVNASRQVMRSVRRDNEHGIELHYTIMMHECDKLTALMEDVLIHITDAEDAGAAEAEADA